MRHATILLCVLAALPGVALAESAPAWQGKTPEQWIGRLSDADMRARWYATYALAQFGPEAASAVTPLGKVLANRPEQEYVRASAAWALGRIGPAAGPAVPLLSETLASALISVRRNSAEALGNLGAAANRPRRPCSRRWATRIAASAPPRRWPCGRSGRIPRPCRP